MKGLSSITKKGRLKALVSFWWIDETLSANLVYLSDHEIGSTNPSGGANEDHVDAGDDHGDQVLDLEKKKEKKKKLKANMKLDRRFFGLMIETLSECDHI